jgi:vancomycin permeability regulator SanA
MRQHTHTSAYLRAVQVPPRHVDVVYETHEQLASGRAYAYVSIRIRIRQHAFDVVYETHEQLTALLRGS